MIEVLVAIVLLSVGVLGATGMQLFALHSNRNALSRVTTIQMAGDLADRIEVNEGTAYGPVALTAIPAVAINCNVNPCSPTQMATYDITQWRCAINPLNSSGVAHSSCTGLGATARGLPDGRSSISSANGEYTITVEWSAVDSNTANSISMVMRAP